jgi:hypothetical protein
MKAALGVIAAAFVFASGCAQKDWIDQTLVTVDVTGIWEGDIHSATGPGGGGLALTLQQKGAKVVGTSRLPATGGQNNGTVEGTVSGDTLRLHDQRRAFTGELQVNGDDMTGPGTLQNWGRITITLHRR